MQLSINIPPETETQYQQTEKVTEPILISHNFIVQTNYSRRPTKINRSAHSQRNRWTKLLSKRNHPLFALHIWAIEISLRRRLSFIWTIPPSFWVTTCDGQIQPTYLSFIFQPHSKALTFVKPMRNPSGNGISLSFNKLI